MLAIEPHRPERHLANLDVLRSFAVCGVLTNHLVYTLVAHAGLRNAVVIAFTREIGHAGVLAFFVHTSLVLMYSLERSENSTDRVTERFYLQRFFRIYPLSIFCVTLAVILHIPNYAWRAPEIVTRRVVIANLLLVQNVFTHISVLSPLWSLPYEVQMYLVLPALYFVSRKRLGVPYVIGILLFVCCLNVMAPSSFVASKIGYVPCFLCGVLCYALRNRVRPILPAIIWPVFLLLLISGYCLAGCRSVPQLWVGWSYCLALALAINLFRDSRAKVVNVVAERIAIYSYGAYLLHVPSLYLVFIALGIKVPAYGVVLFVAVTTLCSVMTYHYIESPFMEVGRRLSSRRGRPHIPNQKELNASAAPS